MSVIGVSKPYRPQFTIKAEITLQAVDYIKCESLVKSDNYSMILFIFVLV